MTTVHLDDAFAPESGGVVEFLARLDAAATVPVSLRWSTQAQQAQPGSDFVAAEGELVFAPGETQKAVRITLTADTQAERTESFALVLRDPVNATLARHQAFAFVRDDDQPAGRPVVRVDPVSVDERDMRAVFVVSLDRPSTGEVTVDFTTDDLTAMTGFDFTALSGTLRFAPGETVRQVAVPVIDDIEAERAEAFRLRLSDPVGADLGRESALAFIAPSDQDDTATPVVDIVASPASESDGHASFVVQLSAPADHWVSVDVQSAGPGSVPDRDHVPVSLTLGFAPGEIARTVRVPLIDDAQAESAQVLTLSVRAANGAVPGNAGHALVLDDDATAGVPVASIHDAFVDETQAFAHVWVTLDRPSAVPVTVAVATASATALSEIDFAGTEAQVVFAPGEVVQSVAVPVFEDDDVEQDEVFPVTLSAGQGATIGRETASVLIGRNDGATVVNTEAGIRATTVGESAGWASLVVQLDAPLAQRGTVTVESVDVSARAGSDFAAVSGVFGWTPGRTTLVVPVTILDDAQAERAELIGWRLVAGSAVSAGWAPDWVVIDDDATTAPGSLPGLRIGDAVVDENEGFAFVPIWLDAPSGTVVSADLIYASASAVAGSDFELGPTTVRFAPGQVAQQVMVPLRDDPVPEPDELFELQLVSPQGAVLSDATGTVRIGRSDMPAMATPSVSIEPVWRSEGDGFASFVVSLEAPPLTNGSVIVGSEAGSAQAGADFLARSQPVSFGPGDTTRVVQVALLDDALNEGPEQWTMRLSAPTRLGLGSGASAATGTVVDDDNGVSQSRYGFGPAQIDRPETQQNATFRVEVARWGDVSQPGQVNYQVVSEEASPADFAGGVWPSGQVSFGAGEVSRRVSFTVAGDRVMETHERIRVLLSSAVNGVLGQAELAGRLQNDDGPVRTSAPQLGRDAAFLFDPVFYLWANPDVAAAYPLDQAQEHYFGDGAAQGRAPNAWFDASWYENRWPDLTPLGLDDATLFRHFNLFGVWEGRAPGPLFQRFDGARYLSDNPDVAGYVDAYVADFLGSRTNGAIAHYIIYGAAEQRLAFETTGAAISLDYLFGY